MESVYYLLLLLFEISIILITALWPIVIYAIIRIILKHKNKSKKSFIFLNFALIVILVINSYFSYFYALTAKTPIIIVDKNTIINYAEQNNDEFPIYANFADGTNIEISVRKYTKGAKEEYDSFLNEYENNIMTSYEKKLNRKSMYDFEKNDVYYSQMYKSIPNFMGLICNSSTYEGYFVIKNNNNYIIGKYVLTYKNNIVKYCYVNNSNISYIIDSYF